MSVLVVYPLSLGQVGSNPSVSVDQSAVGGHGVLTVALGVSLGAALAVIAVLIVVVQRDHVTSRPKTSTSDTHPQTPSSLSVFESIRSRFSVNAAEPSDDDDDQPS